MLTINFELVGEKYVKKYVKISRNLIELNPFKTLCELTFFSIKMVNFLKKSSNFN